MVQPLKSYCYSKQIFPIGDIIKHQLYVVHNMCTSFLGRAVARAPISGFRLSFCHCQLLERFREQSLGLKRSRAHLVLPDNSSAWLSSATLRFFSLAEQCHTQKSNLRCFKSDFDAVKSKFGLLIEQIEKTTSK